MAKFKCEVVWCGKEKGNTKSPQSLEMMESTFSCGGNKRQQSMSVRHRERNSLDPRKGDFLKLMMQSSRILERYTTGMNCIVLKNGVFWDVTPCGSCKNRRFGGT
jgi:hypothetical protein